MYKYFIKAKKNYGGGGACETTTKYSEASLDIIEGERDEIQYSKCGDSEDIVEIHLASTIHGRKLIEFILPNCYGPDCCYFEYTGKNESPLFIYFATQNINDKMVYTMFIVYRQEIVKLSLGVCASIESCHVYRSTLFDDESGLEITKYMFKDLQQIEHGMKGLVLRIGPDGNEVVQVFKWIFNLTSSEYVVNVNFSITIKMPLDFRSKPDYFSADYLDSGFFLAGTIHSHEKPVHIIIHSETGECECEDDLENRRKILIYQGRSRCYQSPIVAINENDEYMKRRLEKVQYDHVGALIIS